MAIKQDLEPETERTDAPDNSSADSQVEDRSEVAVDALLEGAVPGDPALAGGHDVALVGSVSPAQMGARRFVYAGYFAGAIGITFLLSKSLTFAWLKLQGLRPAIGEPSDEIVMPVSALVGVGAAVYYWYRTRARQLAEEVADEMSKVTWPTRTEVSNGTFVVIVTTLVSTVFFALMDRFWGFLTNLVYGGS